MVIKSLLFPRSVTAAGPSAANINNLFRKNQTVFPFLKNPLFARMAIFCIAILAALLVDQVPVPQVVSLHDKARGGDVNLVENQRNQHHDHHEAENRKGWQLNFDPFKCCQLVHNDKG